LKKKFLIALFGVLLFGLGFGGAMVYRSYRNSKSVVLRFSNEADKVDYDLIAATDYLTYQFEQNGYKVYRSRFPGEYYHNEADSAGINVFVRMFSSFYDTRMNKNAINLYYLHRFSNQYQEEMRGYNGYLSSQKNLLKAFDYRPNVGFLEGGAVPHELLLPDYQYDVLYIYEQQNDDVINFLSNRYNAKIFNGNRFSRLSVNEKEKILAQAKIVIYDMEQPYLDDQDYVPYAVYDIISYGRPVMTNYKDPLQRLFGHRVYLYTDYPHMMEIVTKAMAFRTMVREKYAQEAREILLNKKNDSFSQFLKNISH